MKSKKRLHFSITTNIFISFLSLTLVMIGFLWSLEAIFFNKVYKATKENDVEIASNLIIEAIGSENIGSTVEQIIDEYDLCIQVYRCKDASILYNPECKSNGCIIHGLSNDDLYFRWLNGASNGIDNKFSEVSASENGDDFLVFARIVYVDGVRVDMSPKEYELFFYLLRNKNIALSRDKLLQDVWGYDFFGDDRTLDTHIKILRKSLGK